MLNSFFRGTRNASSPVSSALLAFGVLLSAFSLSARAQAPAALPLITQQIDNESRVTLHGTVHPLAQKRFDHGAVDDSLATPHMQLMLSRPADREAALKQFITDAHTKGNASYHKWLTPDQFGKQFGPSDSDVAQVTAWLQTKGFAVNKVSRGKSIIEFGGSAGQVKAAFGTSIHKYVVNGETHYANASAITVPSALAPAVKGLVRLNNFTPKPQIKVMGSGTYSPTTHKGTANWNYPFANNSEFFYVAPGDLAVEYDTAPLLSAGTDGTGVTIGIINDSNIDVSLVNGFRTLFGLKANTPQIIVDGNDPGVNGDSVEAYLDVEEAGALAPGATIDLYVGETTAVAAGIDLAAFRAVDDDTAQILNYSFGDCEADLGSGGNTFYQVLWEQAAAQGQTVMVSSGDSGSEGCYPDGYYGLAVSGSSSTPYNVAVGGTDFYYSDYQSTSSDGLPPSFNGFWNPSTTSDTPATSITGYIPEQPWNGSTYGLNLATFQQGGASSTPVGGGGGQSSCSAQDSSGDCTGGYALPAFQSGFAPSGSQTRSVPDVSLFASNGYNYSTYPICASPGDCNTAGQSATPATVTGVGGTSASSPAFAGIMAMVVQQYGAQGQADYTLYPLSTQFPTAFHDVTAGNNNEPCDPTSQNQLDSSCAEDSTGGTFSVQDWPAATGYDLASGLGSVDANVLVTDWNKVTFTGTTTALTVNPTSITHGATVTLTATVTSSSATGDVAFVTTAPLPNSKGLGFGTLASGVATVTSPSTTSPVADLPGGTYNITAQYEGDGTYGPSASTAQSITVNPEASTLYTNVFDYFQNTVVKSGATNVPYGTSLVVQAEPIGSGVTQTSGTATGALSTDGAATGSVSFTDGSTTSLAIPIDAEGIAEWNPGTFSVGSHSVTAKYAGDASFNASTSTAIAFTVVKGTPLVVVQPLLSTQQVGGNLSVQLVVCNSETDSSGTGCGFGAGVAPTGTVTVTLGGLTQTATLAALSLSSNGGYSTVGAGNYSTATVNFPSVPSGASGITATYSGDTNWNTAGGTGSFTTAATTLALSTTSLTVTPASGSNNASGLTFTTTVAGGSGTPTGTVQVYFDTTSTDSLTLTLSGGTATTTVPGSNVFGGTNQFVAVYSGDTTYAASTSAPATVATVDQSDFNMVTSTPVVSIAAGSSGSGTVNLYSIAGFNAAVSLTCTGNSGLTCSVNPTSLTLNGSSTLSVTINAPASASLNKPQIAPTSRPTGNSDKSFWFAGGSLALAALMFFGIPARQRGWRSMLGLLLFAVLTANFGCGGGGSGGGGGGTTAAATPSFSPAAGSYSSTQSVTISDTTSGASIYYTTDGSTPTTSSTKYSAAISVSKTETLNAIATASGFTTSAVGTAAYTISSSGGTGRTFGPPTTADTVLITATSAGANPVVHSVAIQVAIQ